MIKSGEKQEKIFYRIGEVANMIGENESLLRYWEKMFPREINPTTNKRGVRLYRQEDIEKIRLIHHLVRVKGMTLTGVIRKLSENREDTIKKYEIIRHLEHVKEQLQCFINELDEREK